jgi:cytidine deaminase
MKKLSEIEIRKMIAVACEARENAFVIRSLHQFGACVITEEGELFGGCNIENTISGMGVCTERAAIDNAVVHGKYRFKGIAIVDDSEVLVYPCGACREYLAQFSQTNDVDLEVILAKSETKYVVKKISQLLPNMFVSKSETTRNKIKSYKNK